MTTGVKDKPASYDDLLEMIAYQQGQITELVNAVRKLAQDNTALARDQNILGDNQRLIQGDMAKLRDAVISLSTPDKDKH